MPLQQVEDLGRGTWLATGDDPCFLLPLPDAAGESLVSIELELEGDHIERPCIYVDTGAGWTEAGRLDLAPDGPGRWRTVAAMPVLAGPARLDPSERAGRFRLGPVRLDRPRPGTLLLDLLARAVAGAPDAAAALLAEGAARARADGARAACEWLLGDGASQVHERPDPYAAWVEDHDTPSPGERNAMSEAVRTLPGRPVVSLLLPLGGERHDLFRACIDALTDQCYPDWELLLVGEPARLSRPMREAVEAALAASSRVRVIPCDGDDIAGLDRALAGATGSWIGVLEGMPVLAPHALLALVDAILRHPASGMVYCDSDQVDGASRRRAPVFRPAWNPDLFLARDYIGASVLLEARLARDAGGFRGTHSPAALADLVLRCADRAAAPPVHVPMVLMHWPEPGCVATSAMADARRGALADHLGPRARAIEPAGDGARIHWPLPEPMPRVSIIIPTRDRRTLLERCVESILGLTTYPDYELLVIDNGSEDVDALAYLAVLESRPQVRVLRDARPFNYSALNNAAVAASTGELVALVNNDIEVISPDWLEEMVSQACRPGVGAVGAMLYYPDDTIQHAGVVIGLGGVAGHVYSRQPRGSQGELGRAMLAQELSAVTAACLVVCRTAWDAVGGLDESLVVAFNDVDFCLRLRAAGYRNVWTPHAEMYHHESASRGSEDTAEKRARFGSEVARMVERWGRWLDDDPAYNPNLSLDHGAANAVASPPRRGLRHWLTQLGDRARTPQRSAHG